MATNWPSAPGFLSRLLGGAAGAAGGIPGGPMFEQLLMWQVVGQLLSTSMAPLMAGLQEELFKLDASVSLGPAGAVEAAIKGHLSESAAAAEAQLSGINLERFRILLGNAGDPPALQELMELFRRGVIPMAGEGADSVSLEQGIREGRIKNKWIPALETLRSQLPSPAEVLDAWLKGQIEEPEAHERYLKAGGLEDWFTTAYNANGSAPTPLEAAAMARRGIIPWTGKGQGIVSFQQAFLEGPWRNKWLDAYREASRYIPPPRATTAMLRNGAITVEQASKFYSWAGADAEVTAALVADAHHQKAAATHALVKAEVMALYAEGGFSAAEALAHLEGLGYDAATAQLEVLVVDLRADKALIDSAITRIRSLYIGHRIDEQAAFGALEELKVAAAHRDRLLMVWKLERQENVKILSAAEVTHLVKLGAMEEAEALRRLEAEGYSPGDAWLRLAIGLGAKPSTAQPA